MHIEITQVLQRKLERRIERLKNCDIRFMLSAIKQFFLFLENEPLLKGILINIEMENSLSKNGTNQHKYQDLVDINKENELINIAFWELRNFANRKYGQDLFSMAENLGFRSSSARNSDIRSQARDFVFITLIQPFCDYLIEQIDNQSSILSFTYRYKHRSEWFYSEKLRQIADEEKSKKESGEKKRAEIEEKLALDLYSYLYDEGINFHIAPSSITGKIDLIEEGKSRLLEGQKDSSHRLLADAKVFDGENRNCNYIGKGFWQILRYCKKYNELFGYLIIYNISDGELEFELENTINGLPIYEYYGKTIIFIVIDINKTQADSQAGKAKVYKIQERHILEEKDSAENE